MVLVVLFLVTLTTIIMVVKIISAHLDCDQRPDTNYNSSPDRKDGRSETS